MYFPRVFVCFTEHQKYWKNQQKHAKSTYVANCQFPAGFCMFLLIHFCRMSFVCECCDFYRVSNVLLSCAPNAAPPQAQPKAQPKAQPNSSCIFMRVFARVSRAPPAFRAPLPRFARLSRVSRAPPAFRAPGYVLGTRWVRIGYVLGTYWVRTGYGLCTDEVRTGYWLGLIG